MEKPLLLARVPSEAVVVSAYSSASLCTEILKGLFMLHTVWPAVPVTAVVGAAPRHRSSVPQYLHHTRGVTRGGQVQEKQNPNIYRNTDLPFDLRL